MKTKINQLLLEDTASPSGEFTVSWTSFSELEVKHTRCRRQSYKKASHYTPNIEPSFMGLNSKHTSSPRVGLMSRFRKWTL